MKGNKSFQFLLCLILIIPFLIISVNGQMPQRVNNQVAIAGWTDDSHYLIRTFDTDKNPVFQRVDIKTGKEQVVPPVKTDREKLAMSLPEGTTLAVTDALSPDSKSAVLLKENDLFYFSIGDKELRRLTNDKAPEVNSRFSPDGKKIAYTKNKDLYVFNLSDNKETRLTFDASDKIYNGYCSWVYM